MIKTDQDKTQIFYDPVYTCLNKPYNAINEGKECRPKKRRNNNKNRKNRNKKKNRNNIKNRNNKNN